jgi:hypothetical protein
MTHFTSYAEQKFEILNKHKVFYTREQVEDCLRLPDKTGKKGKYQTAVKDSLKVVYEKEGDVKRVITFFPIKV